MLLDRRLFVGELWSLVSWRARPKQLLSKVPGQERIVANNKGMFCIASPWLMSPPNERPPSRRVVECLVCEAPLGSTGPNGRTSLPSSTLEILLYVTWVWFWLTFIYSKSSVIGVTAWCVSSFCPFLTVTCLDIIINCVQLSTIMGTRRTIFNLFVSLLIYSIWSTAEIRQVKNIKIIKYIQQWNIHV